MPSLARKDPGGRAVKALERKVVRQVRRSLEQGLHDAAGIDDDGIPVGPDEPELTGRRRRVALDMRQPARNMPTYLKLAAERVNLTDKIEAMKQSAAPVTLNIGSVNVVQPRDYPVIDVALVKGGE